MELSTVNLDSVLLDVYYELKHGDIVLKSVEFLRNSTNLLPSLSKKDINKIIEILSEDCSLEVDSDGDILPMTIDAWKYNNEFVGFSK